MATKVDGEAITGLARFACDHCRRKKLKCSRELPKCEACKPWSSSCEYNRDAQPRQSRKRMRPDSPGPQYASPDASVNQILASAKGQNHAVLSQLHSEQRSRIADGSAKTYSSFSFLEEATSNLNTTPDLVATPAHSNALQELTNLRGALSMTGEEGPRPTDTARAYHVPSRSLGYSYISKFLAAIPLGRLFFQEPTDECLRKVIFDPAGVEQKAWVVFINYMLLAMVSTEPGEAAQAKHFRSNMRSALNDADMFLTPSIVNLQTLATLAIHGEDFASPRDSWMLVGHACRQAEALSLHGPSGGTYDEQQRRLSLFWLLFIIDKGCSLAFGRSPSLRTSVYLRTPLPDYEYLARNCPRVDEAPGADDQARASHFGAAFYLRGFELTKLVGLILENGAEGKREKDKLREQLDEWFRSTNTELSDAISNESESTSPTQQHEMSLGLRSFKFQYLHLLIILLRDDASRSALRIQSAREALSILPDMVSNWGSVYNGVVWQLLYLPFGPFFVVFGYIVSDPAAWTAEQDLQHLRTTVSYFESMCSQLSLLSTLSSRLAKTADVFGQLAQHHVDRCATKGSSSGQDGSGLEHLDLAAIESYLAWLPADMTSDLPLGVVGSDSSINVARQPLASNTMKRPVDDVFDWFSWDAYYDNGFM